MERRPLGGTGLAVGVIGMGTWRTFDISPADRQAMQIRREIVSEALEAGVDLFDSSPMYGHAEEVLAACLGNRRRDALVATKVWSQSVPEGRRQIERALAWYGGKIDIYQVHNLVQRREYLPILRALRTEGKVKAIGVTHYSHGAFAELRQIMEDEDIQMVQIPYNAADPLAERELLPLAAERRLGVLVMSPLGEGELVREAPPREEMQPLEPFGVRTWAQALLKWVVSHPAVTATIPATSKPGRMRENAAAGEPPFFGEAERERVAWLASR